MCDYLAKCMFLTFWGGLGTHLSTIPLLSRKQVLKSGWDIIFPTIMSVLLRWKRMFVLCLLHMLDLQSPGYSPVEFYNHEEQFHISIGCIIVYCLILFHLLHKLFTIIMTGSIHSAVLLTSCLALPHSYWHYWHFLFLWIKDMI